MRNLLKKSLVIIGVGALSAFTLAQASATLIAGIFTLRKGKMLTGALITGKISTTVLFISLILLVLLPDLNKIVICTIVIVDGIFLLISFADYIRTYSRNTSMIQQLDDKS
jgi:hypothetical protein